MNDGKTELEFNELDDVVYKMNTIEPINYQYGISYSFDVGYAQQYGVDEAILLYNIIFWLRKNKSTDINIHDGHVWTYNSTRAYKELFPFWSEKQIRRILLSLINQGVLITGHYNKLCYDRTTWYALKDESMLNGSYVKSSSILPNGKIHSSIQEHESSEKVTPIPDIISDISPDINYNNNTCETTITKETINIINFWNDDNNDVDNNRVSGKDIFRKKITLNINNPSNDVKLINNHITNLLNGNFIQSVNISSEWLKLNNIPDELLTKKWLLGEIATTLVNCMSQYLSSHFPYNYDDKLKMLTPNLDLLFYNPNKKFKSIFLKCYNNSPSINKNLHEDCL